MKSLTVLLPATKAPKAPMVGAKKGQAHPHLLFCLLPYRDAFQV